MSAGSNEERVSFLLDQDGDARDNKGQSTEPMITVNQDNPEGEQPLLDHEADVKNRENSDSTSLGEAAGKSVPLEKEKSNNSWLDNYVHTRDEYNRTPLAVAANRNNLEIVRRLINRGADVNSRDIFHSTPLVAAVRSNNLEMATLSEAVFIDSFEIVRLLIDRGVNVNYSGEFECTPLIVAAKKGELEIVRHLLDHGADANLSLTEALGLLTICSLPTSVIECLTKYALVQNPNANKPKFVCHKMCSHYWDECKEQINKMMKEKIGHSTITFYMFLVSDEHELARRVRNECVIQEINDGNYERNFPIYASDIKYKYQNGVKRKLLLDAGLVIVPRFPSWPKILLPQEILSLHILQYLENHDLQNLKQAGIFYL